MGNLTVAIRGKRVEGGRRKVVADITFSNSYATNGDSFVAADIQAIAEKLGVVNAAGDLSGVEVLDSEAGSDGTTVYLDRANKKLKAFKGAEVANTTNLSAITVRCEFVGPAVTG